MHFNLTQVQQLIPLPQTSYVPATATYAGDESETSASLLPSGNGATGSTALIPQPDHLPAAGSDGRDNLDDNQSLTNETSRQLLEVSIENGIQTYGRVDETTGSGASSEDRLRSLEKDVEIIKILFSQLTKRKKRGSRSSRKRRKRHRGKQLADQS